MNMSSPIKHVIFLCLVLLLTACASTDSRVESKSTISDGDLRNTDMDVIFSTEFPVASKEEAIVKAATALEGGDAERALFYYVRALQFDPEDDELLAGIGTIHRLQGNVELAARSYTMSLQLNPENDRALEGRGLLLMANAEPERALVDLEKAVKVNPGAWRASNALGMLADRRGDHSVAREYYNAALSFVPESPVVLNNRGHSNYLEGRYDAAMADLEYVATSLGYEPAWINLGDVYSAQKKYQQAAHTYRNVLSPAEADNKVAEFAIRNEDFDTAMTFLERAIYESPTYFPLAEENLANLRRRQENLPDTD